MPLRINLSADRLCAPNDASLGEHSPARSTHMILRIDKAGAVRPSAPSPQLLLVSRPFVSTGLRHIGRLQSYRTWNSAPFLQKTWVPLLSVVGRLQPSTARTICLSGWLMPHSNHTSTPLVQVEWQGLTTSLFDSCPWSAVPRHRTRLASARLPEWRESGTASITVLSSSQPAYLTFSRMLGRLCRGNECQADYVGPSGPGSRPLTSLVMELRCLRSLEKLR